MTIDRTTSLSLFPAVVRVSGWCGGIEDPGLGDGIAGPVLGKDAMIRNKRAVGRRQDLVDIDKLQK